VPAQVVSPLFTRTETKMCSAYTWFVLDTGAGETVISTPSAEKSTAQIESVESFWNLIGK
jgi:hypothetical protein